jgi:hypothetical protein
MPESLHAGEVLVRDAQAKGGSRGYSHAHIIRLIKLGQVTGRKIETLAGGIWVVNLASLQVYHSQTHKPGPKPKKGEG